MLAAASIVTSSYGHSVGYEHAAPLAIAVLHPVTFVTYAGHGHRGHSGVVSKAVHYPPLLYGFGYDSVDDYGTKQFRHEVSDEHNNKKGLYSFGDAYGIERNVNYAADAHGFRVNIKINKPRTAPSHPAAAHYDAQIQHDKDVIPVETYAKAPIAVVQSASITSHGYVVATPRASYAHANPVAAQAHFEPVTSYAEQMAIAPTAFSACAHAATLAPFYGHDH